MTNYPCLYNQNILCAFSNNPSKKCNQCVFYPRDERQVAQTTKETTKPQRVWTLSYEWCEDGDCNTNSVMVFSTLEKAQKQYRKLVDDEMENGWIADISQEEYDDEKYFVNDDGMHFEAFPTEYFLEQHILITIEEVVVDDVR